MRTDVGVKARSGEAGVARLVGHAGLQDKAILAFVHVLHLIKPVCSIDFRQCVRAHHLWDNPERGSHLTSGSGCRHAGYEMVPEYGDAAPLARLTLPLQSTPCRRTRRGKSPAPPPPVALARLKSRIG